MYLLQVISVLSMLGLTVAPRPPPPFDNELSENVDFECDPGYGIYRVVSQFSGGNYRRKRSTSDADRRWGFECKKIDFWHKVYCDWFVGINLAGENMFFQCPSDAFMAGVRSVFDCDVTEDRVWDVKCCRILTVCMEHCYLTDFIAGFHGSFLHTADNHGVFVGIHSVFSLDDQDRRFRFTECQVGSCGHPSKHNSISKEML